MNQILLTAYIKNKNPISNNGNIQLMYAGNNDILQMESNKSSDCRSHPPPPRTDFKNFNRPENEVVGSNPEFFFDLKEQFENKSFEKQIDNRNSQVKRNLDLKSFTQPNLNRYLEHHDDNFDQHATSPNSHPAIGGYNSFMYPNKINRFKIDYDDNAFSETKRHPSHSDPHMEQQLISNDSSKGPVKGKCCFNYLH